MTNRQKAFLFIFIGSIMGGAISAVTKVGLIEIPPLSFAFLRFFGAAIIITPFYILKKKRKVIKDFIAVAPISVLAAANIALFTIGVKTTTATISQILYAGVPIIIGLVSHFLLSEKLGFTKISGIAVGFIGVIIVIFLPILEKGKAFSGDLTGNMLIATGVISWSLYIVFSKRMQKNYSPFVIVSIFIILTAIVLFPFFLIDLRTNNGWWINVGFNSLISLLYVVIIGTIITYLLMQYAIKHGGIVFSSMAFYLQPVFGFLAAFIILGEGLTTGILIGGILALLGVFFVTKK
ncbi:MAG: DMT family transporter [Candidatus Levybacteria bacterium]|nr:DMT family transporter [Candidatus Levybacteria bacterium]